MAKRLKCDSAADGAHANSAPILLLGFNCPQMMRGLVDILRKARPPKLYLAVDGPRFGHAEEARKCAECAAALDNLDWQCKVRKLVRDTNLGCRIGVSTAIDWFFSQEEEGIILEDDCWPDLSFLRFATELLERYRDNQRIGIISGYNAYGLISDKHSSYRFTSQVHIWGWATWRRVWALNCSEPDDFLHDGEGIVRKANLTHRGRTLANCYLSDFLATASTWDVPWMLSLQRAGRLNISPQRNLVANMGYAAGEEATHTGGFSYDQYLFGRSFAMKFPLVHPKTVERDDASDRREEYRSFAWLPRILTVVGLRMGAAGRAICAAARMAERICPALFRV